LSILHFIIITLVVVVTGSSAEAIFKEIIDCSTLSLCKTLREEISRNAILEISL
jgi:hypothetical protein